MTGDGIPTNEAAMRRMYLRITRETRLSKSVVRYSLLAWICSSHIANLTCNVAIVGDLISRPVDNDLLVGNCVRWFKYLLHDYWEDFALSLRRYVSDKFKPVVGHASAESLRRTSDLLRLYGGRVLPPDVCCFFDGGLPKLGHVMKHGEQVGAAVSDAFSILHKHLLRVEEKPVPTRFFPLWSMRVGIVTHEIVGDPIDRVSDYYHQTQ